MSTAMVPVTVHVPVDQYQILAALAEGAGCDTLSEFIQQNINKLTVGSIRAEVVKLHAQGLSDKEIADELHITRSNIQAHRLKCGLFANPPKRQTNHH